mmetsp:Transcript_11608/g.22848  ORF Transcript_11608/g.22848 Transcript_11608/m.22848 type:complete len:433 (-) Transcript_11608:163-1461(-)
MGDEGDDIHTTENIALGAIVIFLMFDILVLGTYAVCRMYGAHRYIISHYHETVSSFFSYMGDYRYRIFVAVVFCLSNMLLGAAFLTFHIRHTMSRKMDYDTRTEAKIHILLFVTSFVCAILSKLLIFPLKLGTQTCNCLCIPCTPRLSYNAHYVGGVAFLLVNPLANFAAYFGVGVVVGFNAYNSIVVSIFGASLLFGIFSLGTKHSLCTDHLCCGMIDPEERTGETIRPEKAFPKGQVMSQSVRELKAIKDAELVFRVMTKGSKSYERSHSVDSIGGGFHETNEAISRASGDGHAMDRAKSAPKTLGTAPHLHKASVLKIGDNCDLNSRNDRKETCIVKRDQRDLDAIAEESVEQKEEMETQTEATTTTNTSVSIGVLNVDEVGELTEAKRPCLRLWSTGCEIAAIFFILLGNFFVTGPNYAFVTTGNGRL